MKTPDSLATLVDYGIIQEVIRPLMSGKEAQIYVVLSGGEECVAKVYKEASQRTFKHRAEYTEGRRTRNSRDQRAVSKRTRHGRKQDEAAWRSAEVDMIYRLRDAGVRVPEPINFVDGVLVMELVKDAQGSPAPRLGELRFGASEAHEIYRKLIREVVRMLCAGVVHGDLSDFNVLMGVDGPVLIDFPQSVDPAHNQNARKLLLRDVENMHRFLERFAPDLPRPAFAQEMWSLYESNRLRPDTELRGDYLPPARMADTKEVLSLIDDANRDEQARRHARGVEVPLDASETAEADDEPKPMRQVVDFTQDAKPRREADKRGSAKAGSAKSGGAQKKRRVRRRRKGSTKAGAEATAPASRSESAKAEKPSVGSSTPTRPKRRRRGGRSGARQESGEAKGGAQTGAQRPPQPKAGKQGGSGSGGAAPKPRRRRSRRTPQAKGR